MGSDLAPLRSGGHLLEALREAPVATRELLRLRRGDDYSIVDTSGPDLTYEPERLSMERPADRAWFCMHGRPHAGCWQCAEPIRASAKAMTTTKRLAQGPRP